MLVRNGTLVMTVDGAKLAVFKNVGKAFSPELELVEEQESFTPRTSELGTDRPGRNMPSGNPNGGAHENTDFHQQEEDRFAIQAASRLNDLADEALILVAAPRVLGTIRKHLRPEVRKALVAEIDKDFAGCPAQDLAKMLANHSQ